MQITELRKFFSNGNRKLGKDTLIFNITSAHDCPSRARGLCQIEGKCYARKAENMYPAVLPYRRRQANLWVSTTAQGMTTAFLRVIMSYRHRIKYVRLNEAGDFVTQGDVDKAEKIAAALKIDGVTTYCYTARSDLDFSGCKALLVKGSSHDAGNNGRTIARPKSALTARGLYMENGEKYVKCPGSCKTCKVCKTAREINVVFPIH